MSGIEYAITLSIFKKKRRKSQREIKQIVIFLLLKNQSIQRRTLMGQKKLNSGRQGKG